MNTDNVELRQRNASVASIPIQRIRSGDLNLPPQDRGKDAWLLLLGAFIVEGFVWGYAFSFGVFQEAFSSMPQFVDEQSKLPIIGTTCTGIMYLVSPLALPLLRKYPHRRRQSMIAGTVLLALSFIAASFSKTVNHLIITLGIMVGIGASMAYYPVFSFLNDWSVSYHIFRDKADRVGLCSELDSHMVLLGHHLDYLDSFCHMSSIGCSRHIHSGRLSESGQLSTSWLSVALSQCSSLACHIAQELGSSDLD